MIPHCEMKWEIMNGTNREIVADLRLMANTTETLSFNSSTFANKNVTGNYDDLHRLQLDAISHLAAVIKVDGRMGHGNFAVGNPITFSFLDRVPGFVGSGVKADAKGLSWSGTLGGRMKYYKDDTFPQDEFLIGYKGPGALDTGYIHAPYLPITATPTLHNQLTGDPIKIFYTRYGKTWRHWGGTGGGAKQALDKGQYNYARLKLLNFPHLFG